ncbi:MAG: shikimate dehydrogenase [Defluviitaleaceae bacterium]|nr:shikimate dehydrogenase [Defluviitaleaceae bacterium]
MIVTGKTRMAGLIGANTRNSLSPYIHNFLSQKMGQDALYAAFDVDAHDLADAVKGAYALGFAGLNVTAPHKISVMDFIANLDKSAEKVSAVNLLKYTEEGVFGYNTDVCGVLSALKHHKTPQPKSVTILGTGGASKSAQLALSNSRLTIINRNNAEAGALHNIQGDLFVQATSATPEHLLQILPPQLLSNFGTVFDMNYPKANPWLDRVKALKIPAFDGIAMLAYQAIKAYEIIWSTNIPEEMAQELFFHLEKENGHGEEGI